MENVINSIQYLYWYVFTYIRIYIYRFSVPGRLAVIIEHLRLSLDKMLHDKFKDPTLDIYNLPILEVTCDLLDSKNY